MRAVEAAMAVRSTVSGVTSGVLDCGLEALPDGDPEAPAADGDPAVLAAALDAMLFASLASPADRSPLTQPCCCFNNRKLDCLNGIDAHSARLEHPNSARRCVARTLRNHY